MVVGHHVTVLGNNEARAQRLGLAQRRRAAARLAEEVLEQVVEGGVLGKIRDLDALRQLHAARLDLLRGADVDHRIAGLLDQLREVGQAPGLQGSRECQYQYQDGACSF